MVIVSGFLRIRPGRRDAFLALSRAPMIEARKVEGCRAFVVAPDPLEDDRVNVYEEWETESALRAFRRGGPGPELTALIAGAEVRRHQIASSGPA